MDEEKSEEAGAFCPDLGLHYESLPTIAKAMADSCDGRGRPYDSPVIWAQLSSWRKVGV